MEILIIVLLILAVVLFLLDAFGVVARVKLTCLGLACVAAALLLPHVWTR